MRGSRSAGYLIVSSIFLIYLIYTNFFFQNNGEFVFKENYPNYATYANSRLGIDISIPHGWMVRSEDPANPFSRNKTLVAQVMLDNGNVDNGVLAISRYPVTVGENRILETIADNYVSDITGQAYGDYFNMDISSKYHITIDEHRATVLDIVIYPKPERLEELSTQYRQMLIMYRRVYVLHRGISTYSIETFSPDNGVSSIFDFVVSSIQF